MWFMYSMCVLIHLWDLSIAELKALIALLLVRGAYNKNIDMESFWSEEWRLAFFNTTTPSNRYWEIMCYLRFDKKACLSLH